MEFVVCMPEFLFPDNRLRLSDDEDTDCTVLYLAVGYYGYTETLALPLRMDLQKSLAKKEQVTANHRTICYATCHDCSNRLLSVLVGDRQWRRNKRPTTHRN